MLGGELIRQLCAPNKGDKEDDGRAVGQSQSYPSVGGPKHGETAAPGALLRLRRILDEANGPPRIVTRAVPRAYPRSTGRAIE